MGRDGKEKIRRKGRDGLGQDGAITASVVLCVFAAVMAAAGGYLTETGSEESVPVIVDIIEETSAAKAQTAARGGAKDDVEIIDDVVEAVTSVIDGGEAGGETASAATLAGIAAADIAAEAERAGGDELININTATAKELESLYGIGEKLADAIIEYREEQPFETIEDIMKVKGIGAGKFDKIKDSITC
ncbi:MAG: helix-hairpin-helix domain-containing protein [Oscillospiraceae bacterium]|nr:helix-hairpin-helix domain-containing protein [Oscillospiraceae bacterium]